MFLAYAAFSRPINNRPMTRLCWPALGLVLLVALTCIPASVALDVVFPLSNTTSFLTPRHRRVGVGAFPTELYIVHTFSLPDTQAPNNITSAVYTDSNGVNVTVTKRACVTSQVISRSSNDRALVKAFVSGRCDAIILIAENSDYPGSDYIQRDSAVLSTELNNITIPVVEGNRYVYHGSWEPTFNNGGVIIVRLKDDDTNQFYNAVTNPAWVIAYTFLIAASLSCVVWASNSLASFVKRTGFRMLISHVILLIQIIANALRAIYMLIMFALYEGLVTYYASNIFFVISFPLNLVSNLLILLYWNELMTKVKAVPIVFLETYRRGFFIFIGLLFVALMASAIAAMWIGVIALLIIGTAIAVLGTAVFIGSLRVGMRVRAQLLISPPSGKRKRLLRATTMIMLSASTFPLWVIAGVCSVLPMQSYWFNIIGYFYMWFWMTANSVLQIGAFAPQSVDDTVSKTASLSPGSASRGTDSTTGSDSKTSTGS